MKGSGNLPSARAARVIEGQAWWEWFYMKGAGNPGAEALAALLAAPQDMPGPWAGLTLLDLRCGPAFLYVRLLACARA
jgi:hypothetical protein